MISRNEQKASLSVRIQPNASKNEVMGMVNGTVKIKVTAPPIDDKANKECIKFLSKVLQIPKANLCIIRGQKARSKVIEVLGMSRDICLQRLTSRVQGEKLRDSQY